MIGSVLVLAPHLVYPLRNGGDLLIARKWSEFSNCAGRVDILGMNSFKSYENGVLVFERSINNSNRNNKIAAIRCIFNGSHYLLEKYMTRSFVDEVHHLLLNNKYDTLVCSLITTVWPLMQSGVELPARILIETQNDEIKWYQNIRQQSHNWPEKITAFFSERWLVQKLPELTNCIFIHVAEEDDYGYRKIIPAHRSIVIPVGADEEVPLQFESMSSDSSLPFVLIFSGSLTTKINYDALNNFETRFFPFLRKKFSHRLQVVIAGSNPSEGVRDLCSRNQWLLHENVSDEKLRDLFRQSLFSILPFSYTTGGKLKLLKSLALGVPFLASSSLLGQLDSVLSPCLISDDPEEWISQIEFSLQYGIKSEDRLKLIDLAKKYSWGKLAELMYNKLSIQ